MSRLENLEPDLVVQLKDLAVEEKEEREEQDEGEFLQRTVFFSFMCRSRSYFHQSINLSKRTITDEGIAKGMDSKATIDY